MNKTNLFAEKQDETVRILQDQIDSLKAQLQIKLSRKAFSYQDEKIEIFSSEVGHEILRLKHPKHASMVNPELTL